jgi:hypothetical protein
MFYPVVHILTGSAFWKMSGNKANMHFATRWLLSLVLPATFSHAEIFLHPPAFPVDTIVAEWI